MGEPGRWSWLAIRQRLPVVVAVALVLWIGVVAGRGVQLVVEAADLAITGETRRGYATPQMLGTAALITVACLLVALLTRRFRPAATLPFTIGAGGAVLLVAAVRTGSGGALLVVLALLALSWLLGDVVMHRLPPAPRAPLVRMPLAIAVGLGLLGLLFFLFAAMGRLSATAVLGAAAIVLISSLLRDRRRLGMDLARLRAWRPEPPSWFETIVLGLSVGLVTYALLAAFVPEIAGDVTSAHLPIAREIWQTGALQEDPFIPTSSQPIQAHLLYAVVWGFGGMTAAKLLHAAVGLVAIVGVAGLGALLSGRVAAFSATALFATLPLVLWQLGHAFPDFFPILFTVAATLVLLLWQRDGEWVWLLTAGILAGVGFTSKPTAALMIAGFAAAIGLVGRGRWRWRARLLAVLVFALGATLVAVPWLLRSHAIIASLLLGPEKLINAIVGVLGSGDPSVDPGATGTTTSSRLNAGFRDRLLDVVQSPWLLTFHADQFGVPSIDVGPVGFALLLLLPLAFLGPRPRAVVFLAVSVLVAFVSWWFSPLQVGRHLLPALALAAVLCGIGVANVFPAPDRAGLPRRLLSVAAPAGVIVGLLASYVFFVPAERARLAVDVVTGRQSAADYVAQEIPLSAILAAASAQLPPDTVVGYSNMSGAAIYTESRLRPLDSRSLPALGATPEEVLANLERGGIDYLIWDRTRLDPAGAGGTLLSTAFLREHTRILAGDEDGYLFAILPEDGLSWGEQRLTNLLDDPGLERLGRNNGAWSTSGRVNAKRGSLSMSSGRSLSQRVAVSGDQPYLLSVAGRCTSARDRLELALRWFDAQGAELRVDRDEVVPGSAPSEQFQWRRAPGEATAVSAEILVPEESRCELANVELYRLSS